MRKSTFLSVVVFFIVTHVGFFIVTQSGLFHQEGIATADIPRNHHTKAQQKAEKVELGHEFLTNALQEALDAMVKRLHITDKVEKHLLFYTLTREIKVIGSPKSITIILMRPSKTKETHESFEYQNKEQGRKLKFVKIRTPQIAVPFGILVKNTVNKAGQIIIEESALRYENGKWHKL